MVEPSDGLFEEDPLAVEDEDVVAEDEKQDEVDWLQERLDNLEDEEYEERIMRASRHPDLVLMKPTALPVLEHDVFNWLLYERLNKKRRKGGHWIRRQEATLANMLPDAWNLSISPETPVDAATSDSAPSANPTRPPLKADLDSLRESK